MLNTVSLMPGYDEPMNTDMTEFQDWLICLTFAVPRGNETGDLTMTALECALEHHPSSATGFSAAGTRETVTLKFNLLEATEEFAVSVSAEMEEQITEILSSELSTPVSASERSACAA